MSKVVRDSGQRCMAAPATLPAASRLQKLRAAARPKLPTSSCQERPAIKNGRHCRQQARFGSQPRHNNAHSTDDSFWWQNCWRIGAQTVSVVVVWAAVVCGLVGAVTPTVSTHARCRQGCVRLPNGDCWAQRKRPVLAFARMRVRQSKQAEAGQSERKRVAGGLNPCATPERQNQQPFASAAICTTQH